MNIELYRKNAIYLMGKRDLDYAGLVKRTEEVAGYHCLAKDIKGFLEKGSGNPTMRKMEALARALESSVPKMLETDIEKQDRFAF